MKNRLLTLFLATALVTSLIACGGTQTENAEPTETVAEETEIPEEEVILAEDAPEANPDLIESTETIETEEIEIPEYIVTDMSATKYAKSSVNVRSGPSSEYERVGGLSTNQQVTVTGQADTGWYRIEFNGEEAFVSDSYLVDEKVVVSVAPAQTQTTTEQTQQTQTTTNTDTTAQQTQTQQPTTDNTQTWVDPNAGAVQTPVQTPAVDNSASTGGTAIDGSNMSIEDLANLTGDSVGQTGDSNYEGIGGDWGGFVD